MRMMMRRVLVEVGREGRRRWGGLGDLDGLDGVGEREGRVGRRGRWRGRSLLLPLLPRPLRDQGWDGEGRGTEVDDRVVVVVAGVVEGARRRRGFGGWKRDRIAVAGVDSS